jgi:hypothetical protein
MTIYYKARRDGCRQPTPEDRRQRLRELLGALGAGAIDVAAFWRYMAEANLNDADIDRFCEEEGGWCPDEGVA